MAKMISRLVFPILILLFVLLLASGAQALKEQEALPPSPEFKSGVIASANHLASEVGLEILRKGGNAVDAAMACAFTLGVVEPNASGIGGGGFMLIYLPKFLGAAKVVAIDFREMAPARATAAMFLKRGQAQEDKMKIGPRSVAVPGTVAGLTLALQKYGTMALRDVLEPAIQFAEQGFAVSKLLNSMMVNNATKLLKFPAAAGIYLKNGRPYKVGALLYQKDLAETYRLIAAQGPEVFYRGAVAEAIAKEMQRSGGLITREDLANYRPFVRPPVEGNYRGYEIISIGPPSSGGVQMIELLNILEGYDMASLGLNSPQGIEIMAEAMQEAFSDRAKYMGDPDFVKIPVAELLSKKHAEQLRKEIEPQGQLQGKSITGAIALQESDQTTHLSVADKDGNLVALSQSIDAFFGSGVVVPGTGILLNDGMGDFSPEPDGPNSIAPGKRPLSNMAPTIVLKDGRPYLTIGMPGGTRIPPALTQVLMNLIDHRLTLQEAINAPRIHRHTKTGELLLESRIPRKVRNALAHTGYSIVLKKDYDIYLGGAQGVTVDEKTGMLSGAADPRREGAVSGY